MLSLLPMSRPYRSRDSKTTSRRMRDAKNQLVGKMHTEQRFLQMDSLHVTPDVTLDEAEFKTLSESLLA